LVPLLLHPSASPSLVKSVGVTLQRMVKARRCQWPSICSENRGNQTKKIDAKRSQVYDVRSATCSCKIPGTGVRFQAKMQEQFISRKPIRHKSRLTGQEQKRNAKHTAAGIPTWSPTVVLICRSTAYVWQSGRDAQFSADCGRMCLIDQSDY
jgi:hypothetical protein